MKKRVLSISVLFIAFLLILPVLCSCNNPVDSQTDDGIAVDRSNSNYNTVLTVDGTELTKGMYSYYLVQVKSNLRDSNPTIVESELWKSQYYDSGMTYREFAIDQAKRFITQYAVINKQYELLGLTPTLEYEKNYNDIKAMYLSELEEAELKLSLEGFGMTLDDMISINMMSLKLDQIMEALYGEGGSSPIGEEEIKKEYDENYVRIKHIQINTVKLDEQSLQSIPFSDEKLAEATIKAESLFQAVKDGQDFDKLMQENTDDKVSLSYPDGYIFKMNDASFSKDLASATAQATLNDIFILDTVLKVAAFEMADDEVRMIETFYGYDIVKKYDINNPENIFFLKRDDILKDFMKIRFSDDIEKWNSEAVVIEADEFSNINFDLVGKY